MEVDKPAKDTTMEDAEALKEDIAPAGESSGKTTTAPTGNQSNKADDDGDSFNVKLNLPRKQ